MGALLAATGRQWGQSMSGTQAAVQAPLCALPPRVAPLWACICSLMQMRTSSKKPSDYLSELPPLPEPRFKVWLYTRHGLKLLLDRRGMGHEGNEGAVAGRSMHACRELVRLQVHSCNVALYNERQAVGSMESSWLSLAAWPPARPACLPAVWRCRATSCLKRRWRGLQRARTCRCASAPSAHEGKGKAGRCWVRGSF